MAPNRGDGDAKRRPRVPGTPHCLCLGGGRPGIGQGRVTWPRRVSSGSLAFHPSGEPMRSRCSRVAGSLPAHGITPGNSGPPHTCYCRPNFWDPSTHSTPELKPCVARVLCVHLTKSASVFRPVEGPESGHSQSPRLGAHPHQQGDQEAGRAPYPTQLLRQKVY